MNNYEISVIECLINIALQKDNYNTPAECSILTLKEIKLESERIMSVLPGKLRVERERSLDIYIQYYQQGIINLMQRVIDAIPHQERKRLNKINPDIEWTDCYKMIYNYLEQLLQCLQMHFPPYIDAMRFIPVFYHNGPGVPQKE